jgi:hypothetical protein
MALRANIRLGWKVLPGTNNLAYYVHGRKKSFITLVPGLILARKAYKSSDLTCKYWTKQTKGLAYFASATVTEKNVF